MKLLGLGRISITTKIAASMSLLIIFIMLALGSVTIFQLNEALQRGEADKGRYLTGDFSQTQLPRPDYEQIRQG